MMCAWQELLGILPVWIRGDVDRLGKSELRELRLRLDQPPELVLDSCCHWLTRKITGEDIAYILNTATRYSPWNASTVARGYLTAVGGHRIGVCGEAVIRNDQVENLRNIHALCIRVCRDFRGIGSQVATLQGSVLLLGPPGSGKTTLLRDTLRCIAEQETVSVVDERAEIFPGTFPKGKRMDVLTGCPKAEGIDMVLRSMAPSTIGVDEITSEQDCDAMIRAGWCGVRLIATAHAASVSDLKNRPVYRHLTNSRLFDHILVLGWDKSWREERMVK